MQMKYPYFLNKVLLLSIIALLPACTPDGWCKQKGTWHACGDSHSGGDAQAQNMVVEGVDPLLLKEILVSADGKPLVVGYDFERQYKVLEDEQPAIKEMLPHLPKEQRENIESQLYNQIAEGLTLVELAKRDLKAAGVLDSPEFKQRARNAHEAVDRDLILRSLEGELQKKVAISDQDAEKYYNENRATDQFLQRPPFVNTFGGTKAQIVEFDTEKEAKDFLAKAKAPGAKFEKVVEDAKRTIGDYGLINQQSFIDPELKSKILGTKKFPALDLVKGSDDKYYVVNSTGEEKTEYATFDAIKDDLKRVLMTKQLNDLYTQHIAQLKDKYKVESKVREYLEKRKTLVKPLVSATPELVAAETEEAVEEIAPAEKEPAQEATKQPIAPAVKQQGA